MLRALIVIWDILFSIGGWYLYQNPHCLSKGEIDNRQMRINKIGGILIMVLGLGCTAATLILALVKHSK